MNRSWNWVAAVVWTPVSPFRSSTRAQYLSLSVKCECATLHRVSEADNEEDIPSSNLPESLDKQLKLQINKEKYV